MLELYLKIGTINKNVIKVNDDKLPIKRCQSLVHHSHERNRHIGQSKWHNHPLIQPLLSFKHRFPLITRSNANLMISTLQIKICEHRHTTSWSSKSSNHGIGNLYCTMILLIAWLSIHILHEPSFLGVKGAGTAHGLRLSRIYPFKSNSSTWRLNSSYALGLFLWWGLFGNVALGTKSI